MFNKIKQRKSHNYSPSRGALQRQNSKMTDKNVTSRRMNGTAWVLTLMLIFAITIAISYSSLFSSSAVVSDTITRFLSQQSAHKPLFPLNSYDKSGFIFATLGLMIAAGGGIGGGGMLVPIYILVMQFDPKHAIPLSNITVFGGACANTLLNLRRRHPLTDRPLIDWDLMLVMEPLTIAGALMGAFLNKVLNETLLMVTLVVLLTYTAYTTLKKAVKMYKKESAHLARSGQSSLTKESELTRMARTVEREEQMKEETKDLLSNVEMDDDELEMGGMGDDNDGIEYFDELKAILEQEKRPPMMNIVVLVSMFLVVLTINLLKGGGAFPSPLGIKCGEMSFWISNGIILATILVIFLFARSYLVKRWELKQKINYSYVDGDIQWDRRATTIYPCICCFAGFFAGMFGIGGGIVNGPLMLAMGIHPAVAAANTACMIFFTSFTASTSFVVFGLLIFDYGAVCLLVGFTATLIGQIVLSYLMKKFQRNSYIAFSIGAVVAISAILMTAESVISMAEGESHPSGGICG